MKIDVWLRVLGTMIAFFCLFIGGFLLNPIIGVGVFFWALTQWELPTLNE